MAGSRVEDVGIPLHDENDGTGEVLIFDCRGIRKPSISNCTSKLRLEVKSRMEEFGNRIQARTTKPTTATFLIVLMIGSW